ncbi:MAG TPA: hypothetical protein VGK42_08545 [Candidatus Dormibacteraeota bacterium]|jgi:hypothetical protein
MDYFDRLLSLDLARMLDPIVATRPPRRGRSRSRPRLKIWINPDPEGAGVAGPNDLTMQAVPLVVEPVVTAASGTAAYS